MTLATVLVSGQLYSPDGSPAAHADVRFALSGLGVVGLSLLVPRMASAKCDATGAFALQVVPSPPGTFYAVRAGWDGALLFNERAVVPATACQLTQIMQALPYPAIDASQQALIDLQAAQGEIEADRLSADGSAGAALISQSEAADSAGEALGYANTAGDKAGEAAQAKLDVDAIQTNYAAQFVNMAALLLSIQTTVAHTNPL